MEERLIGSKEVITSLIGATLPAALIFVISVLVGMFYPESEVRVLPSLVSNSALYVSFENRGRDFLPSIGFSVFHAENLKVLTQSGFAVVKLEKDDSKNSYVTIDKVAPHARTTILFGSDSELDVSSLKFTNLPGNVSLVRDYDLFSKTLSANFWAGIMVQTVLYAAFFFVGNLFLERAKKETRELSKTLESTKLEFNKGNEQTNDKIVRLERRIKKAQAVSAKYRLYTRSIYSRLESENRFWRTLLNSSLQAFFQSDRHANEGFLREILKKAGIKRASSLDDLNIDMLIRALESESSEAFAMQAELNVDKGDV